MPYITPEERPYWDQFVNPLLDELLKPGATPPSKAGLTYALSRIVWAIFNHFPSWTVSADLRSVLIETAAEFKRRKQDPYEDNKIVENGDLPEGSLASVFPDNVESANTKTGTNAVTATEALPEGVKVVKLSEVFAAIKQGKSIEEIFATAKAPPAQNIGCQGDEAEQLCDDCKTSPGLYIVDHAAETAAEVAHLLALKAFTLAQINGASEKKLTELSNKIAETTRVLLRLYKGEKA